MVVEFLPGSAHAARVTLNNPKDIGINYVGRLKLVIGNTTYASSGLIPFSIPARGSKDVGFPITMPATPNTYAVYLDVYIGGMLASVFVSGTPVIVMEPPPPAEFEVSDLSIVPTEVNVGEIVEVSGMVTNVGGTRGTYVVNCDINPSTFTTLEVAPVTTAIPWTDIINMMVIVMFMGMAMNIMGGQGK